MLISESLIIVVNVNARNMEVAHMVKGATQFVKEWMTIGAWEARIEDLNDYILQIATKIEERQYKRSKQAAKVFTAGLIRPVLRANA